MTSSAIFSEDRKYRYQLRRSWNSELANLLFIGLNPSTADEHHDDPTLRRLIGFAKGWGYGSLTLCNLYAYCTPSPKKLFEIKDPIGLKNDQWIIKSSTLAEQVVLVYGNHGKTGFRDKEVLKLVSKPYCVAISKLSMPKHPLYLKYTKAPIPYLT